MHIALLRIGRYGIIYFLVVCQAVVVQLTVAVANLSNEGTGITAVMEVDGENFLHIVATQDGTQDAHVEIGASVKFLTSHSQSMKFVITSLRG